MSGHHRLAAAFICACALWSAGFVAPDFSLFTDPARRFSVEFPKDWAWTIVAGSGEPLVMLVHPRKEAAVIVEHFRLKQPLAQNEITDLFAQIESDVLKENQPRAEDVVAKATTQSGKKIVVIDYSRPGIGERERVRQYSFPVMRDLYRITCMALASQFKKYEVAFGDVAESLKTAGELGPARAPQVE